MTDYQSERRQAELNEWQSDSLNHILGSKPCKPTGVWKILETLVTWFALFWMGIAAIWVVGAVLGFYGRMFYSGWEWGWSALAWLMEFGR